MYDRQIRLWGVKAQNCLKQSRTLVIGLNALGAELCKNIVLAGLNVSVIDGHVVEAKDRGVLRMGCPFALKDKDGSLEVMLVGVGVVGGGAGRESKSIYRVVVLNATDQELSFSSAQIRLVKVERLLR